MTTRKLNPALIVAMAVAIVAALVSAHAFAQQALSVASGRYELDRKHASVIWRVNHLGVSMYTARFTAFAATLDLNAADASKSRLDVTIDPASVRTDFPDPAQVDFDKEIAGEKFFDAAKYPKMTFTSTALKWTGRDTGTVTGNLTFHGVTKPVTLNVKLIGAKRVDMLKSDAVGVQATGVIRRSDFGVTYGVPFVGDAVELSIDAEFHAAKAA